MNPIPLGWFLDTCLGEELDDLHYRLRSAVRFTRQDFERMEGLQRVFECRQKIGLSQDTPAQTPTEEADPHRPSATKQRPDEQGAREHGVKHRPTDAIHPQREREALPNRLADIPSGSIASIFNKSAEDLSSSVPSSAGKTPPVHFIDLSGISHGATQGSTHSRDDCGSTRNPGSSSNRS